MKSLYAATHIQGQREHRTIQAHMQDRCSTSTLRTIYGEELKATTKFGDFSISNGNQLWFKQFGGWHTVLSSFRRNNYRNYARYRGSTIYFISLLCEKHKMNKCFKREF